MKRVASVILVLIIMISSSVCAFAARGELYAEYVPRSERGTLFYVDVYCDTALSAAGFTVDYDGAYSSFYDVYTAKDASTVKARDDGGRLTVVFCDPDGVSGRLFRLAFKQFSAGTVSFGIKMTQGVDKDLKYISPLPECTLSAALTESSGSASSRIGSSMAVTDDAPKGKRSGELSVFSAVGASGDEPGGRMYGLSKPNDIKYFMLGVGAAILAGLLVFLGMMIGRRSKTRNIDEVDSNNTKDDKH